MDSPEDCLYAPDTVSFAKSIGLFPADQPDEDFSFSDIYDPVTFEGARFCEARVWSFFGAVMGSKWSHQYLDYAQGYNLTNRMPLFVKPLKQLSPQDVMQAMRNHYEGTALDGTGKVFPDVGAAQYADPNRKAPTEWTASDAPGRTYFNERNIGQAPTGWSIVCQARPNVPRHMAALLWFGIDDSSTSVHWPLYGSATRVPKSWAGQGPQDGVTPPLMKFSLDSAFYVFNLVANFAYSRWDLIYADVHAEIIRKEGEYFNLVADTDAKALSMFDLQEYSNDEVVEFLTSFSYELGDALTRDWFTFFGELFVKFRDGYVTTAGAAPVCGCQSSNAPYQDEWYNRIVADTGDIYLVPPADEALLKRTTKKTDLRAFN
jgi:dipeptidase